MDVRERPEIQVGLISGVQETLHIMEWRITFRQQDPSQTLMQIFDTQYSFVIKFMQSVFFNFPLSNKCLFFALLPMLLPMF